MNKRRILTITAPVLALALTALALAVMLVLARDGVRRAEAQAPYEINISVIDNMKGTPLPSTCWYVYDSSFTLVDVVSDNNAKPAVCDSQGPGKADLTDTDPADGLLRIPIPGSVISANGPFYFVLQKQAPVDFTPWSGAGFCDFSSPGKCEVYAWNVFTGKPNIDGTWNLTFAGGLNATCTVVINQSKGTTGSDPITVTGCGFGTSLSGSVGGGQMSASAQLFGCVGIDAFTMSGPVSWNGNMMNGSYSCVIHTFSGTFTGTRKPTGQPISIVVEDNLKGTSLPNTCWEVFYQAFGKNIPVDIVSDDNAKPAACDNVIVPGAGLTDEFDAAGSLVIPISGALRAQYGDQWHVQQVQAPTDFNVDPTKFACDLSLGGPCEADAVDVFTGKPNIDGLWNLTFTITVLGVDVTCTADITQTKGTTGSDPITVPGWVTPCGFAPALLTGTVGGGNITASGTVGSCSDFSMTGAVSWNGNLTSGTWSACSGTVYGPFTGTRKPTDQQINITVAPANVVGYPLPGTCWQVFYVAFGKNIPVDIVSDNNGKAAACDNLPHLEDLADKDAAVGSIKITISGALRGTYGDQWHVQQYQAPPDFKVAPNKFPCDLSRGKCNWAAYDEFNGTPSEINITSLDKYGQPVPALFYVNDTAQNHVGGAADGSSTDLDSRPGFIRVNALPGTYHIVELLAGGGVLPNTTKQVCVVPAAPGKCEVTFTHQLNPTYDSDGDGCTNVREMQTAVGSQTSGGRRNPKLFWDYAQMPTNAGVRDGKIRINDISAVVLRYGTDDNNGAAAVNRNSNPLTTPIPPTGYHPAFDRSYVGPSPWNLGPPDGKIRINDVANVVQQFHHDCA